MKELTGIIPIEGRAMTVALPIDVPRSWFFSVPLFITCALMIWTSAHYLLANLMRLFGGATGDPSRSSSKIPARWTRYDLAAAGAARLPRLLEVPIVFALPAAALIYLIVDGGVPLMLVVQRIASGLESYVLLAIPLFILAGNLFNSAGIARRIFDFAVALVGHIKGSLGHVNILASVIFAGMSGVAQADAAGLGAVEVREMKRHGFTPEFSAAITAVSAIIGPIIPRPAS